MPKKITVSLKGILREIEKTKKQLKKAEKKAARSSDKKLLALAIKNLTAAGGEVKVACKNGEPAMNYVVLTK